jgi:hypothetical protein
VSLRWIDTRAGALLAAVALFVLGLALAAAGFAVSSALGGMTTVVALGPFVVAIRLLVRAFRGARPTMVALFVALVLVLAFVGSNVVPYLSWWDPFGEEVVVRGPPLPPSATGTFVLQGAFAGPEQDRTAMFDATRTVYRPDPVNVLILVDGRAEGERYVTTEVALARSQFRIPWDGHGQYWRLVDRCEGEATFDGDAWQLAFTDTLCSDASGRYVRSPHATH